MIWQIWTRSLSLSTIHDKIICIEIENPSLYVCYNLQLFPRNIQQFDFDKNLLMFMQNKSSISLKFMSFSLGCQSTFELLQQFNGIFLLLINLIIKKKKEFLLINFVLFSQY